MGALLRVIPPIPDRAQKRDLLLRHAPPHTCAQLLFLCSRDSPLGYVGEVHEEDAAKHDPTPRHAGLDALVVCVVLGLLGGFFRASVRGAQVADARTDPCVQDELAEREGGACRVGLQGEGGGGREDNVEQVVGVGRDAD